ncbi:phospholipase B1, membrane-associated-like [Suncus etruscus]|uniref:phospholipase B1, membrane-associated-like n=1 Tax=Suncus etruscus TaxID=109475 RepID=UPI0021102796|nr:phospholipase B1, membrane-associated-like [Suncus etruscus]
MQRQVNTLNPLDVKFVASIGIKETKLDFKNDWKIINLFLSNAHECYLCPAVGQRNFVKSALDKLTKTLDYLQQEVPRLFVNLVDLTDLLDFIALPEVKNQNSNNTNFCKCSEDRVLYKAYARMTYQELWESVLATSKYNQQESFALVFQPFFYDPDLSHLLEDLQLKDPSSLGVHLWNLMPNDVQLKCSDMNPSWTIPNSGTQPLIQGQRKPKLSHIGFASVLSSQTEACCVKVVAAVGDSVLKQCRNETLTMFSPCPVSISHYSVFQRGLSGGKHGFGRKLEDKKQPRKNYILRKFNSELIGYTLGHGMKYSAGARLNQAMSGDISMDMSNQVTEVIRKMKNDKKINYNDDWKLLTMFIGGQDLCYYCIEKFNVTPEILQNGIQHALDILQGEFNEGAQEFDQVVNFNKKYQRLVEDLIYNGHYDRRHDFTVVLQPFLERFEMPRTEEGLPDLTYFDPDCFHFSQKTLGHVASALWNSMVSQDVIQCPDMSPSKNVPISGKPPILIKIGIHSSEICDKSWHVLPKGDLAGRGAGSTKRYDYSNLLEFRGVAFSMGGDGELPSVKTLPNILRKFNSNIKGPSVTVTRTYRQDAAYLNLATPPAITQYASRIFQDHGLIRIPDVSLEIWRFQKLFAQPGARGQSASSDSNHCLVQPMPTTQGKHLPGHIDLFSRDVLLFKGTGLTSPSHWAQSRLEPVMNLLISILQIILTNLIWSGRYDTKSDFTVVLQPFLDTIINPALQDGKSDSSYFSIDCHSISQKGHGKLAYALWNNMLEDLGNKTRVFDFSVENSLMCPGMQQDWGSDFFCENLKVSPHSPSSASKLQPADIEVVAAMGDWVTVSNGHTKGLYLAFFALLIKVVLCFSLKDILLKFSSVIHGISRGSWPELAGLNVAEEKARVQDMPEQANKLLQKMELDSNIDMDNDWKLITIFIGINDLCDYCNNQLPKVFINLVEVMDVTSFYPQRGDHCVKTPLNCPCFHGMAAELNEELLEINMYFQEVAYKLSFSSDFASREDFAVVSQPFFRRSSLMYRKEFRSLITMDCKFFSSLMQNQMAIALWNNMVSVQIEELPTELEPVGYKTHTFIGDIVEIDSSAPVRYRIVLSQQLDQQAKRNPLRPGICTRDSPMKTRISRKGCIYSESSKLDKKGSREWVD